MRISSRPTLRACFARFVARQNVRARAMPKPATPQEGVTKFDLAYTPSAPLPMTSVAALIAWRMILWRLGLIGLDPARYGGVGFGNVSARLPGARRGQARFAISGT